MNCEKKQRILYLRDYYKKVVGFVALFFIVSVLWVLSCNEVFGVSYSITYDDGVTNDMPVDVHGSSGANSITLPSIIPGSVRGKFNGWCLGTNNVTNISTSAGGVDSCSSTLYAAGASIPIDQGDEKKYLYAIWTNMVDVKFTFNSGVTSLVVNGTTITQSGTTLALSTDVSYEIKINYGNGYELNSVSSNTGYAQLSKRSETSYIINAWDDATINVEARLSPIVTFNFDSGISSIVVNNTTITQSGARISLHTNATYTVSVTYGNSYMATTTPLTVSSGDATTSSGSYSLKIVNEDSVVNVNSQTKHNVNVTFSLTNITSITVNNITVDTTDTVVSLMGDTQYTVAVSPASGYTFDDSAVYITGGTFYGKRDVDETNNTFNLVVGVNDGTVSINGKSSGGGGCITADTLITLSDGSKKRVADLTGEEELLVWDFDSGAYTSAPIVFVEPELEAEYEIIHLFFENESDVEVVYEHGFFDYTLNKYIYINSDNPEQYIGHEFVMMDGDTYKTVKLTEIKHETRLTTIYGPTTYKHFNFFNNDMLSIGGGIVGMFNYFDVEPGTLKYDQEKKQSDIVQYGLLTYEDFDGVIDRLAFDAYNGQYLAVSVGKGLITWDGIKALAERYGHFTSDYEQNILNNNIVGVGFGQVLEIGDDYYRRWLEK